MKGRWPSMAVRATPVDPFHVSVHTLSPPSHPHPAWILHSYWLFPFCVPSHVPCSRQLPGLPSYNFLIWNCLWIPLDLTKIVFLTKPNAEATPHVLSFPAPPACIDLLHLASLYSLHLWNLKVSGTQLFTSVYTVFFYMNWSCFFPSLSCLL